MRFFATIAVLACACALPLWPSPALAQAPAGTQYTEIAGTGQTLYKVAVAPAIDGGAGARVASTVTDVLGRDLTLIGLFKVLSPKSFLANLEAEGVGIVPEPWINVGAQGVIKAKVMREGKELSAEFYLYDLGKGKSPVLTKTYKGTPRSARRLAHRFGNDVVKYYTGEKGIFLSKLAFATMSPKSKTSFIYVMDYDGHGVYKVSHTGRQNVLPSWSPGGLIGYTSFLWRNSDFFVVPSAGGRARRISKQPGLNTGGAWSPNGGSLAITLSKDGNAEIYIISTTGEVKARLTDNAAIDTSPTWSPDGSRIAFVSNRGGSPQIYVMPSTGGSARRLTFQGNYNQEPDWNPRGDKPLVAFTGRDEKGAYDIFTVNVDSGELKRLTQGQGSNKSPTWAPNGRMLAFTSSRGGIWIMNEDGFNQHRVYRGGAQTPAWSK